jgi:hypothetical protein
LYSSSVVLFLIKGITPEEYKVPSSIRDRDIKIEETIMIEMMQLEHPSRDYGIISEALQVLLGTTAESLWNLWNTGREASLIVTTMFTI